MKEWGIQQEREWNKLLLPACLGKLSPKKMKRMEYLQKWRDNGLGPSDWKRVSELACPTLSTTGGGE